MKIAKIINDPVYGFINLPKGIILELIDHPYFQRLRRIKQLGLSHLVYPGAMHVRFHHAIGAFHLMTKAISILRQKGVDISEKEEEAVCIAILLHDIGHGPFSHALEHQITPKSHEDISLMFMHALNEAFDGRLSLAITIFQDKYDKPFLYQLISSQMDLDRMDYLNRDSFYTGVSEGVIGYHRIINMLNVKDGQLAVEEKGIYSVESFLMARRIMYWQVYLHKTVIVAEKMLQLYFKQLKMLVDNNEIDFLPTYFQHLLQGTDENNFLTNYAQVDDSDIIYFIKRSIEHKNETFSYLAKSILDRNLYKIKIQNEPFSKEYVEEIKKDEKKFNKNKNINLSEMILEGSAFTQEYLINHNEINILGKDNEMKPFSVFVKQDKNSHIVKKYYIIFPPKT